MRAASYLRVSGQAQISGDGFPRQRDAVDFFIKGREGRLVSEYRDEGVSGTMPWCDRPGLSLLFVHALEGNFDTVVVESARRLARDLIQQEMAVAQFIEVGVAVFTSDGFCLTDNDSPDRVMIRQILGAVAQFNKSELVHKLKVARDRKRAATGRCEGPEPYGCHDGEAPVLDMIRSLSHWGPRRISAFLNQEGVKTRNGGSWHPGTVSKILRRLRDEVTADL